MHRLTLRACSVALGVTLFCACSIAPRPFKGGSTAASLSGGLTAQAAAPEAPSTPTTQTVERETLEEYAAPAPSVQAAPAAAQVLAPASPSPAPAPQVLRRHTIERAAAVVGVAQKDDARELAVRMSSMRPVQFAGLFLIAAALAMFHPAVRLAVGAGKEMQLAAGAAGALLVFAPQLLAGNEKMVLGAVAVGLLVFWLLSRGSYKAGQLDELKNRL